MIGICYQIVNIRCTVRFMIYSSSKGRGRFDCWSMIWVGAKVISESDHTSSFYELLFARVWQWSWSSKCMRHNQKKTISTRGSNAEAQLLWRIFSFQKKHVHTLNVKWLHKISGLDNIFSSHIICLNINCNTGETKHCFMSFHTYLMAYYSVIIHSNLT